MTYVIFFLVVLLLGGVAYLWYKYGKKQRPKQPVIPEAEEEVEITEADIANLKLIPQLRSEIELLKQGQVQAQVQPNGHSDLSEAEKATLAWFGQDAEVSPTHFPLPEEKPDPIPELTPAQLRMAKAREAKRK